MWRHRTIKQKKKRQQKVKIIKRGGKNSENSTRVTGWFWSYFKISHEAFEGYGGKVRRIIFSWV